LAVRWPGLSVVQLMIEQQCAIQSAHFERVVAKLNEVLRRLRQPDHGGVDAILAANVQLGTLQTMAMFSAVIGHHSALDVLSELERVPGFRAIAWRIRMVYGLMHGNAEAASSCQRRAELLNLQDGGQLFPGITARVELLVYSSADDLLGVKR